MTNFMIKALEPNSVRAIKVVPAEKLQNLPYKEGGSALKSSWLYSGLVHECIQLKISSGMLN